MIVLVLFSLIAARSGVSPLLSARLMSAPDPSRKETISSCPNLKVDQDESLNLNDSYGIQAILPDAEQKPCLISVVFLVDINFEVVDKIFDNFLDQDRNML